MGRLPLGSPASEITVVDQEQLERLHATYVWHVNAAVGAGRMDLVEELAEEYETEALRLLTAPS